MLIFVWFKEISVFSNQLLSGDTHLISLLSSHQSLWRSAALDIINSTAEPTIDADQQSSRLEKYLEFLIRFKALLICLDLHAGYLLSNSAKGASIILDQALNWVYLALPHTTISQKCCVVKKDSWNRPTMAPDWVFLTYRCLLFIFSPACSARRVRLWKLLILFATIWFIEALIHISRMTQLGFAAAVLAACSVVWLQSKASGCWRGQRRSKLLIGKLAAKTNYLLCFIVMVVLN